MKKSIFLFVCLLIISVSSIGQNALINTTHSNVRNHGIKYSKAEGITLTFNKKGMAREELNAMEGGIWVLDEDFVIDNKTCRAIGAPSGTYIKKGKWDISSISGFTCKPGYGIKKNVPGKNVPIRNK